MATAAQNRLYYAKNRDKIRAKQRSYRATNQVKERARGLRYREGRREEERERVARWSKDNRARANALTHRWRARKRSALVEDSAALQARVEAISCVWCGTTDNIHVDHIWPLSKGGAHAAYNLQPLCGLCNSKKGSKILLQLPEKALGGQSLSGGVCRAAAPALAG